MKRAFIAVFAALLAVTASAITATKEYVDRKDADKRGKTDLTVYVGDENKPTSDQLATTSTVTKVVSLVITNSVKTGEYTPWTFSLPGDYAVTEEYINQGDFPFWQYVLRSSGVGIGGVGYVERETKICWEDYVPGLISSRSEVSTNALGIAFMGDLDKKIGEIDAESIGAFPAADGRQLAAQVSAQGAFLNAEDARFVSTNYDSKVRLPEAYFEIKLPSGEWARMWSEMTRWNWFLEGIYSPWTNAVAAALATKGEKEWGFFDAATGEPAPDGFLWVSMPRIAICAGAAYQRIAEAQGSYWVLESNGMVAELSGTTNGFFRIVDDEGKAQFEIIKGDKRTLFAAPGAMVSSVMGVTHYHVTYSVTNAVEAPVAQFSRSISDPEWFDESDSSCPANVSWTKKDASTYVCEWWPKSAEPSMFMRAAFAVGGETRIRQTAPVEMERIVIGGKTYTLTVSEINGKKVLTLE